MLRGTGVLREVADLLPSGLLLASCDKVFAEGAWMPGACGGPRDPFLMGFEGVGGPRAVLNTGPSHPHPPTHLSHLIIGLTYLPT